VAHKEKSGGAKPLFSFIYNEFLRNQLFMLTFIRRSITTLDGGGIASYQTEGIKIAPKGAFLL
ncbi:hypothetical protein, partial [Klebsiella pneumoniae]|uniref:hypothetical protein n=1 Tax=Klebsiella pneumoniae TaxID=573 RepID=UPI001B8D4598